jgi:hypothetical protein
MNPREIEALGAPDIQIAGLRIWVHGRQFEDSMDYWDGNWLRVTAYCIYPDAIVRVHGSIIHLGEIAGLKRDCAQLHESLKGVAKLDCIEPNLSAKLEMHWNGGIGVQINITPDHLAQTHSFEDALDQTYLPGIIRQCDEVLSRLPIRDADGVAPGHAA